MTRVLLVLLSACLACRAEPLTEWVVISEVSPGSNPIVTVVCAHGSFYLDADPAEIRELLQHRMIGDSINVTYDKSHLNGSKFDPSVLLR